MYTIKNELTAALAEIENAGLTKRERLLTTPQGSHVTTTTGEALNFCANNYLGLADHPAVVAAAKDALDELGFGMASVRFICGTQEQHTLLERELSEFLGTEDTILYSSCFDANGGVFEVLCGEGDAIVSDELNHASIIDGVRLSRATRYRYRNGDVADLRARLEEARAAGARRIAVVAADHGPRHPAEGVPDGGRPSVLEGGALDLVGRGRRAEQESGREGARGVRHSGPFLQARRAQPLTAPCMMPLTNCLPAKTNTMMSGMVDSSTPASTIE